MKKVKLKFYGTGYNNIEQVNITIYDECNNIVFNGKTFNSIIELFLQENKIYKLYAFNNNEIINKYFYVNDHYIYAFAFKNSLYEKNFITFLLTDYFYNNLPIERGEIILYG